MVIWSSYELPDDARTSLKVEMAEPSESLAFKFQHYGMYRCQVTPNMGYSAEIDASSEV